MDLSQLSDDQLRAIAGQQSAPVASMSNEQLMAIAKQAPNPADYYGEPSALEAGLIGAGKQLTRLGQGIKAPFLNGADAAALKDRVTRDDAAYKPLADAHPWATGIGEGVTSLPFGPAGMAAMGALEYGTPEERAMRAAGGFVGGKVGQAVGKGIGMVAQPIRSATADVTQAVLDKFGLQGLPGQITGSKPLQWIEQTLAQLPGGGRIRDTVAAQRAGLTQETVGRTGSTGDKLTPEAVEAAMTSRAVNPLTGLPEGSGPRIGTLTSAVPAVGVDRPLLAELNVAGQRYANKLDALQKPMVAKLIQDIRAQGNTMTGEFYQQTRSDISAMAQGASGTYKNALTDIYKALDRAFDRSAPSSAVDAVKTARAQYGAGKKLLPMSTIEGDVSPARIANAAKYLPPGLRDLSELGSVMRSLPMSGTAERQFYQNLFTGGSAGGLAYALSDPQDALGNAAKWGLGAAGTKMLAPWLATQAITRAPLKDYLTKGLLDVTPEMEKILKRLGTSGGGLLGLSLAP